MDPVLRAKYFSALEEVIDPEIEIDIVNLGLVYDIEADVEPEIVKVTMTLTSMGCPLAPQIMEQVRQALVQFEEVSAVNVNLVWTPQWSKERMSRFAKIALGVHDD